jgi:hypothetical protein
MITAAFIGRMRARLNRIWSIVGIGMGFVNIMTFAIVQKNLLGLSVPLVVASVALVIVGLPTLLVYCEERFGWWGAESLHIWKLAGYDPVEMAQDIKEIKAALQNESNNS